MHKSVHEFHLVEEEEAEEVVRSGTFLHQDLHRPPPLNTQASPTSDHRSLRRNSSHGSNLVLFSPKFTPLSIEKPFFQDNSDIEEGNELLNIIVIHYHPGETNLQTLDAFATRLTPDFYARMYNESLLHNGVISFRLQADPFAPSPRRYSLDLDDQIIASPKKTNTVSSTNHNDTMCSGHLPEDPQLAFYKQCPLDNNALGVYPVAIQHEEDNLELLHKLQNYNPDIVSARMYHGLICYAKRVPLYQEFSGDYIKTSEYKCKHFIQESERLDSIIDRIHRGVYKLIVIVNAQILFSAQNDIVFKIDLCKLASEKKLSKYPNNHCSLEELEAFINADEIGGEHACIFYTPTNNPFYFMPVMVQAGSDNGFPIAPDADPEHNGIDSRMPWMAFII